MTVSGVGSDKPCRIGVHSTFLGLVYLMAVKTSFPCVSARKDCRCSSLTVRIGYFV